MSYCSFYMIYTFQGLFPISTLRFYFSSVLLSFSFPRLSFTISFPFCFLFSNPYSKVHWKCFHQIPEDTRLLCKNVKRKDHVELAQKVYNEWNRLNVKSLEVAATLRFLWHFVVIVIWNAFGTLFGFGCLAMGFVCVRGWISLTLL